jgi:hypothetical protein
MKNTTYFKATVIAALFAVSGIATAGDSNFEKDFVNKTLLGNWKAQTVTKDDQVRNVDASRDRFLDNILGKTKAITPEDKTAQKSIDASLKRYTGQFSNTVKS